MRRNTLTDFTVFEDTFGYKLPQDIGDLINLFWHPYIYGYYKLHECIILFSCQNHKTEADDDIMCQKNGIPANEPFAGSLKELIRGLSLKTV